MKLFLGNYFLCPSGPRSVSNLSNLTPENFECAEVSFNDNTTLILPKSTEILSDIGFLEVYNHKKFRHHEILPTEYNYFNQSCYDPYLIGVLCNTKCKYNIFYTSVKELEGLPFLCDHFNLSVEKSQDGFLKIFNNKEYLNVFTPFLIKTGLSSRLRYRHIPENYLYSDMYNRKELLAGIVDANVKINKSLYLEVSSVQLAKDIAFLIRSLGGIARVTKYSSKDPWYKIVFSVNFNPCKLREEYVVEQPMKKKVVSIKNIGPQPTVEVPVNNLIINDFVTVN